MAPHLVKPFYITLPSGSSAERYPNNTLSHYKTWLSRNVALSSIDWEVAVAEICFPKTFYNVHTQGTVFMAVSKTFRLVELPPGYYAGADALVDEINSRIKTALSDMKNVTPPMLKFRASDNKVKIIAGHEDTKTPILPVFSPDLGLLLGFSKEQLTPGKIEEEYGKNEANLLGELHTLYLESDLCTPSFCGNDYKPLLRTVHVPPGNYGENICIAFSPPLYVPVLRQNFQEIDIYIRDEKDRPIQFQRGRVLITLHLRPQK